MRLEILSLVPTVYRQCSSCETVYGQSGFGDRVREEMTREYPVEMLSEHARLSVWVEEIAERYGDRIEIQLIDAQSALGLLKSVRHWVRQYPTFIIGGRKVTGWDRERLEAALLEALSREGNDTNPVRQEVASLSTDKIERKRR